jgi:hypothetical protein
MHFHIRMYVYIYCICKCIYIHIYDFTNPESNDHIERFLLESSQVYDNTCIHVRMYVHIYICIDACMYIYI